MTAVADRAGSPGRPGTTRRRAARQGLQGRIHGRPWPTSFHPLRPGTRLRPRQWEGSRSRWTSRGGRNRCACAGGVRSWEIRSSRIRDGVRPCGGDSGWRHWGEERVRGWAERLRRVVAVLRGRDLWTQRRGEEEGLGRGARCQWRPRFGCAGEWVRARATALGVVRWTAGRGSGRGLAPRGARSADLVAWGGLVARAPTMAEATSRGRGRA